ncbi:MAG: ArsR family transcriptional regulator [Desulfobacteraceae bacterium]|nr:MAG: ArsR family transcriptional regulator [Desulfobacteraceae bacterium]
MKGSIHIFKALADPTRLKLVDLLLSHDLCVGALAGRLGISKPAVSQHLQILRKAGLVKGEKRGYWTHYSVEREILYRLSAEIREKAEFPSFPQGACQRTVSESTVIYDGRRTVDMCSDCCRKPENLKGKPEECSPEQIKACHGDSKNHPCVMGKPEAATDDSHR